MGVCWRFAPLPALVSRGAGLGCAPGGARLAAEVAARFAGFPRSLRKPLIRVVRDHAGASTYARRAQRSQTGTPRRAAQPSTSTYPRRLTASTPHHTHRWGGVRASEFHLRIGSSSTPITRPIDRGRSPSSSMARCVPVCAGCAAARAARAHAPLRGRWARRVDEEAPACSRSTPISGFRRERGNPAQRGATSALAKGHTRARPVPQRATHTPARTAPSAPNHRTQP